MSWPPRWLAAALLAGLLAILIVVAQPSPPPARANPVCDLGAAPAGVVTEGVGAITGGIIGGGNPVGDACNAVSGEVTGAVTAPITDALKGVGNGIFQQITSWVAGGASWLIGQVVKGIEETTPPQLTTKGFLTEYSRMAQIAALMGLAMLLLAVLEGLAQGNAGLLARVVLINLPLAFIATSVAYTVVQLLLVATDGMCHAIAAASHDNSQHFFKAAIAGLGEAGGEVGKEVDGGATGEPAGAAVGQAAGTVEAPLFVTFLAAIIGAFAAFGVWLELLMRDAAIYVVALFMPLALAASIWPRWGSALRRTGELLVVVIGSKFVIVAIISLAAGLLTESGSNLEHILAASALMLLACFAPFVLLKLVPFAEGAMSAAYGRRSASSHAMGAVQTASNAQVLRNMAHSNWEESGATLWNADEKGGGGAGPEPGGPRGGGGPGAGPSAGGSEAGGESAAGGAAAGAGAAAAVPAAAIAGTKAASQRLQGTAIAQEAGSSAGAGTAPVEEPAEARGGATPREGNGDSAPSAGERPPRPAPEPPGPKPEKGSKS
jgi:type IV secretion system protein TrbL